MGVGLWRVVAACQRNCVTFAGSTKWGLFLQESGGGASKVLSGYWPWLGEKVSKQTPRLVFLGGVARRFQMHAHSPGSRLQLCPRRLSSRWEDDVVRAQGSRKGRRGRRRGGDRGRDLAETLGLKAWPLGFKLLLPTVACLPFSRHVQQQEWSLGLRIT